MFKGVRWKWFSVFSRSCLLFSLQRCPERLLLAAAQMHGCVDVPRETPGPPLPLFSPLLCREARCWGWSQRTSAGHGPRGDVGLPAANLGVALGIQKFLALCLILDNQLFAGIQRLQGLISTHAIGKKKQSTAWRNNPEAVLILAGVFSWEIKLALPGFASCTPVLGL